MERKTVQPVISQAKLLINTLQFKHLICQMLNKQKNEHKNMTYNKIPESGQAISINLHFIKYLHIMFIITTSSSNKI